MQKTNDGSYLNINNGSKLAEVLVEFCDIVELAWDLAHFQLGVNIMIPLWKTALMLVVKVLPKQRGKMEKSFFLQ